LHLTPANKKRREVVAHAETRIALTLLRTLTSDASSASSIRCLSLSSSPITTRGSA